MSLWNSLEDSMAEGTKQWDSAEQSISSLFRCEWMWNWPAALWWWGRTCQQSALTHVTANRSMKTVSPCSVACCECGLLTQVLAAQMLSCLVRLWVSGISYDTRMPSGQDWALILMSLAANTKENILLQIQSPGTILEFRMWYKTIYHENLHCADFSFANFSFGVLPRGCYSWFWSK